MKYVIHSMILFNTTEYTLQLLNNCDNHELIKLSSSAGQILEELIKHRNTQHPVTREHLFSIVWKNHGLTPSNGNLNQQISLIRKSLTSLGLNLTSIITIPKRGLKLNNQLTIQEIEDKKSITPSNTQYTNDHNTNTLSPILLNFKSHIKYITTLTIMVIILSIGLTYFYTKTDNIKLYCCKEINSCDICRLYSISNTEYNNYDTLISEFA